MHFCRQHFRRILIYPLIYSYQPLVKIGHDITVKSFSFFDNQHIGNFPLDTPRPLASDYLWKQTKMCSILIKYASLL